MRSITWSRFRI